MGLYPHAISKPLKKGYTRYYCNVGYMLAFSPYKTEKQIMVYYINYGIMSAIWLLYAITVIYKYVLVMCLLVCPHTLQPFRLYDLHCVEFFQTIAPGKQRKETTHKKIFLQKKFTLKKFWKFRKRPKKIRKSKISKNTAITSFKKIILKIKNHGKENWKFWKPKNKISIFEKSRKHRLMLCGKIFLKLERSLLWWKKH